MLRKQNGGVFEREKRIALECVRSLHQAVASFVVSETVRDVREIITADYICTKPKLEVEGRTERHGSVRTHCQNRSLIVGSWHFCDITKRSRRVD